MSRRGDFRMTDRYTELFAAGVEQYDSAEDAWADIKEARERVDWDPDTVRTGELSGTELQFQTVTSDD